MTHALTAARAFYSESWNEESVRKCGGTEQKQ